MWVRKNCKKRANVLMERGEIFGDLDHPNAAWTGVNWKGVAN